MRSGLQLETGDRRVTWIPFNLNHMVRVKLTPVGRRIHREDYMAFWREHNPRELREYAPPIEDAEGWSEWQGWCLFALFGDHLRQGCDLPFDLDIQFEAPPKGST